MMLINVNSNRIIGALDCLHDFNIYIYICKHENNFPSRLSPQSLCGNSCLWGRDVRFVCVSWILSDHLYYAPCLGYSALFFSLVPEVCNRISCAQAHVLPQSHSGDNREGTLFS